MMAFEWNSWIGALVAIALALLIALAVIVVVRLIAAVVARKVPSVRDFGRRIRSAWTVLTAVMAVWIASAITLPSQTDWWPGLAHVFLVVTIVVGSWFLAAVVSFGFEQIMAPGADYDGDGVVGARERRKHTQLLVMQRLVIAIIAVVALGSVLFSFPELRALGTSLLASAGIAGIVAGLAAQSILGNLVAGIQLAFTDVIRVGDVVVVEGEQGRIGEMNLSYVVVYVWDERRLIVPCIYFTSNPIETWTRKSDQILGVVLMDLDWRVPMDAVRAKFYQVIEATDTWDRRSANALVTGSEGGHVTVRFVMSSKDSDDQWNLRCEVREKMIAWLQQEYPDALPNTRVVVQKDD